jgi:putative copper export protein
LDAITVALTVMHITAAAAWFGHKLGLTGELRTSIHAMEGSRPDLAARVRRRTRIDAMAVTFTFLTGGGLVAVEGIGELSPTVLAGIGAAVVLVGVMIGMTRPARRRLSDELFAGRRPESTAAAKAVARATAAEHVIWIVALTLMVV